MSEPTKIRAAREQLKTTVETYSKLSAAGVPVFIERDGQDIDNDVENALNTKGLAIIVLSATAGVIDQARQGAAVIRLTIPVCVLENVERNLSDATGDIPAGTKISSESAILYVMEGVIGKEIGSGCATLAKDVFARGGDSAGLIENYIGIDIPITVRGT